MEDVITAIHEAVDAGIRVKINAVPVRGLNDHDLVQLAELARNLPVDVRFIELMPVGCGANLIPVPMDEVRSNMEAAFGPLKADQKIHGFGPAVYGIPEGFTGSIGFIEALSHEFCHNCNRVRITPEGVLKLCLNHKSGIDLRKMLRDGSSDDSIL